MNADEVKSRAKKIATDAQDVRAQTRDLVVDVIRSSSDALGRFPEAVERVVDGAREGLSDVADDRKADVLREVMDGLSDGLGKGAEAVKLTLEEASSRGQKFADDDLKGTVDDLRTLESLLVDRVSQLIKSGATLTGDQAKDLVSHARRAAEGMRPAISSAIEAAEKNPVKLATDTASVAAGASRKVVGGLFSAVAGVLDGVGDAISGKADGKSDKAE
jgi:Family of unknown function (DUF6781)